MANTTTMFLFFNYNQFTKMTTQELIKANLLNQQIEEKKALLQQIEQGKITGVTVRVFDEHKVTYSDVEVRNLPKNAVKQAMLAHVKNELENLQRQFDKFLTPRENETEGREIQLDSAA